MFCLLSCLKHILHWHFQNGLFAPVLEGTNSGVFVYVCTCECKLNVPHEFCFFIFYCKLILVTSTFSVGILCTLGCENVFIETGLVYLLGLSVSLILGILYAQFIG